MSVLAAFEAAARARLTPEIARYFMAPAGDGGTARANRDALNRLRIVPRVLADLHGGDTGLTLMGRGLAHPIIVAPFAHQGLLDPLAETATAAAATAQGGRMVLSAQASVPLEKPIRAGAGCDWFQLYWLGRDKTLTLAHRAAKAGYAALMLTVDAPVRAGAGPDAPMPNLPPLTAPQGGVFDLMARAPRWPDVEIFCHESPLPVILKGVMHPDDARRAVTIGASGVVVSNHGGRVSDALPASIAMLPAIADAVAGAGAFSLLFDGGIRGGADVFRALALGAEAVMVGQPVLWGLAAAGATGVAQVLRIMRDELEIAMALAGCRGLSDISSACLT